MSEATSLLSQSNHREKSQRKAENKIKRPNLKLGSKMHILSVVLVVCRSKYAFLLVLPFLHQKDVKKKKSGVFIKCSIAFFRCINEPQSYDNKIEGVGSIFAGWAIGPKPEGRNDFLPFG